MRSGLLVAGSVLMLAGVCPWGGRVANAEPHHRSHRSRHKEAPPVDPAVEAPAVESPAAETPLGTPAPEGAPPVTPASDAYVPAPAEERPIATVVLLEEGIRSRPYLELSTGMATALAADVRIRFRPVGDLLDPPDAAARELGDADRALAEANAGFEAMEIEKALPRAEAAIAAYEPRLVELYRRDNSANRLRDAWARLATLRYFGGDTAGTRDALRHAFVLDATGGLSTKSFPPAMKKTVAEAKGQFLSLSNGHLRLTCKPFDAEMAINGVARGRSPVAADDIAAGPNVVSCHRSGYKTETAVLDVASGQEVERDMVLEGFENDPRAPLAEVSPDLGSPEAPEGLMEVARALRVDMLGVVRASVTDGTYTLKGYLYDQRSGELLRKATRRCTTEELGDTGQLLATDLFQKIRFDGSRTPVARTDAKPVKQHGPSLLSVLRAKLVEFRGSRAFWPVVGGVGGAIVIGGALGIGFGVQQERSTEEMIILFGAGN